MAAHWLLRHGIHRIHQIVVLITPSVQSYHCRPPALLQVLQASLLGADTYKWYLCYVTAETEPLNDGAIS